MAMRSGPSTRTTAWVARRHVKWCGGPSGTVANGTLIGSGLSNSRNGRNGGSSSTRAGQAACAAASRWCCADTASTARSGIWVSCGRGANPPAPRNMGVLRQVHDHALSADPRGDAVDQGGQFVIVVHIGVEIALLLHHDFGAAGGQGNGMQGETGIEGM